MVTSKDDVLNQVRHLFRASTNRMLTKSEVEIQSDLSVNIHTSINLVHEPPEGRLPIKLHIVNGDVRADHMGLKTLENFPDVCVTLDAKHNQISSLTHAPWSVTEINVSDNEITSLEFLPDKCEFINVSRNPLLSLKGLPDTPPDDLEVFLTWTPDLPLLRLLNVTNVMLKDNSRQPLCELNQILNKYTGKGKSHILLCSNELKKAGYGGNAAW
jgi:hypothetical protein